MSGGVDSTACALLMKEQGDVSGFFMNLGQPDYDYQKERVEEVAERLQVQLTIIDLRKPFEKEVLDYFASSYQAGKTPNPCIICNKEIKFGLFLDAMKQVNPDVIATGHYARIGYRDGQYRLMKGVDPKKDQSYFLSRLTQSHLASVLFPLGDKHKSEIYELVKDFGFDDFEGKESQDVCFLEQGKVGDYLDSLDAIKAVTGDIVNLEGKVLGRHNGLHYYTIGQRKGLGISDATPYYVTALDAGSNRVIVGKNDDLFQNELSINSVHWLGEQEPELDTSYLVRIRYTHRGSMATIRKNSDHTYSLLFDEPQRAVTPGQFAVLYRDDEVIGSGVIE